MTRKRISRAHSDLCAEPHAEDGKPWLWTDDDSDPKPDRKTLQLCAQIERALNIAWPGALGSLALLGVEPAPDASRLALLIGVPEGFSPTAAMRAAQAALPQLRAEAARAITRKRAPTLTIRLVPLETDHDPQ